MKTIAERLVPKTVSHLPLKELWRDGWFLRATRAKDASEQDVRGLLKSGAVAFAIARIGDPLRWVAGNERFQVWSDEIRPRLIDPSRQPLPLEHYPGEYCYRGGLWLLEDDDPVLAFEYVH